MEEKLRLLEDQSLAETKGLEPGSSPSRSGTSVSRGPSPPSECSQVSPQTMAWGALGGPNAPHDLIGHRRGQGEEGTCPSSRRRQVFRNFWHNEAPHHLQVLKVKKHHGSNGHIRSCHGGLPRQPHAPTTAATGSSYSGHGHLPQWPQAPTMAAMCFCHSSHGHLPQQPRGRGRDGCSTSSGPS